MEGVIKKSKSNICKHCKENNVYEYENTFDGAVVTIQDTYCLECIKKTKDELNCRFCQKLMGYKYGYEYAGDDQGMDWCGCDLKQSVLPNTHPN